MKEVGSTLRCVLSLVVGGQAARHVQKRGFLYMVFRGEPSSGPRTPWDWPHISSPGGKMHTRP